MWKCRGYKAVFDFDFLFNFILGCSKLLFYWKRYFLFPLNEVPAYIMVEDFFGDGLTPRHWATDWAIQDALCTKLHDLQLK